MIGVGKASIGKAPQNDEPVDGSIIQLIVVEKAYDHIGKGKK